ncbi:MAG TPA: 16S rRNA (cytidine(1402)-2'-O)-methyltransferase [Limnochordales bacterium]
MAAGPGQLYICGTPIGNLEDITLRALRVLREVSLIAAEDTRHTRKLLAHFGISTPVVSLHEHNEAQRTPQILERLMQGESVALVSDAGMPLIQDPGQGLVRAAAEAGIPITVIPGPTALVAALAGSGLPTDRFAFEGFLPREARRRRAHLETLKNDPRTLVFYEAPHRLRAALADILAVLGDRPACIARELTKVHEEWQRESLSELVRQWAERTPQGEFVIVVAGASAGEAEPAPVADNTAILERLRAHMRAGADKKAAVQAVAAEFRLPRRTVYQAALALPAEGAAPGTGAAPGRGTRED